MLLRPAAGVALVLKADPGLLRLALRLAAMGLAQALLDGFWYYLLTGRQGELLSLIGRAQWHARYGGPFVLLKILCVLIIWLAAGGVLHLVCRAAGGKGAFRHVLQIAGIAMFTMISISLTNYVHVFLPLPAVVGVPGPGLGHLLALGWLLTVLWQTARQVHGLPPPGAAFAASLVAMVVLMGWLGSAGLLFHLDPRLAPGDWRPGAWLALARFAPK
ncbi:MAG TPA: YIP1 family protein [Symbiobacteriaceae bacterium]|nr:YIP1 family protein [Symbiobacteriaceae bacterium]